jgi:hypothetical protein
MNQYCLREINRSDYVINNSNRSLILILKLIDIEFIQNSFVANRRIDFVSKLIMEDRYEMGYKTAITEASLHENYHINGVR